MLRTIFFIYASFISIAVHAQYEASHISSKLKENANVVVRLSKEEVLLKSKGEAIIRKHYVYTILNSSGNDHAKLVMDYDKLRKVNKIEGTLYDAGGTKIRSLKKNDVKDYSNTSEANLADDDRVKFHHFNHTSYPYSVEYQTEMEYDGVFYLPAWLPVFNENVSVESASLKVTTAADYLLRYKTYNYAQQPVVTDVKKEKEYNWSVSDIAAIKDEPYSPIWYEMVPTVFLAPSSFEMQKYSGSMNNWQEFGKFIYTLNANRNILPDNIKQKVHALTDALPNDKQKIIALYKYLQQNTRYISIQLGIGGWQTLDANFVASKGYGDCKALSNYMNALLNEAGIPSYTALIKAGSNAADIMTDFSSNQFNHVIVCVPQPKDSIWLECTSQTSEPGYMGSFTGNRQALLISEKGGILVKTSSYISSDNLQKRKIKAVVSEEGELKADILSYYSGLQQDRLDDKMKQASAPEFTEYMRRKFNLSSYEVIDFFHKTNKHAVPSIEENVKIIFWPSIFTADLYSAVPLRKLAGAGIDSAL
ncbi:MAG: DUF3857 domain-containing protein [Sphingobacteriales bacterium]|nr:MAG: DUF3857 domain-containing protein [Sphingobacteriales bacterium]